MGGNEFLEHLEGDSKAMSVVGFLVGVSLTRDLAIIGVRVQM